MNLDKMRQWESGEMSNEQEAAFFQDLVNTGLCWKLGGKYMRRAGELIEANKVQKSHESKTA